jgi:hypothetical protein
MLLDFSKWLLLLYHKFVNYLYPWFHHLGETHFKSGNPNTHSFIHPIHSSIHGQSMHELVDQVQGTKGYSFIHSFIHPFIHPLPIHGWISWPSPWHISTY